MASPEEELAAYRNITEASKLGTPSDTEQREIEEAVIQRKEGLSYEQAVKLLNLIGLQHVDLCFARNTAQALRGEFGPEEQAKAMRGALPPV